MPHPIPLACSHVCVLKYDSLEELSRLSSHKGGRCRLDMRSSKLNERVNMETLLSFFGKHGEDVLELDLSSKKDLPLVTN